MSVQPGQNMVPQKQATDIETLQNCILGLKLNILHIEGLIKELETENLHKTQLQNVITKRDENMNCVLEHSKREQLKIQNQMARVENEKHMVATTQRAQNGVPVDTFQSIENIAATVANVVAKNTSLSGGDMYAPDKSTGFMVSPHSFTHAQNDSTNTGLRSVTPGKSTVPMTFPASGKVLGQMKEGPRFADERAERTRWSADDMTNFNSTCSPNTTPILPSDSASGVGYSSRIMSVDPYAMNAHETRSMI